MPKRCVDCGKETDLHLCDRCLEYAHAYVTEHNKCAASGVPMDYGMLQHKRRYEANIRIAEEHRDSTAS